MSWGAFLLGRAWGGLGVSPQGLGYPDLLAKG
mgnify:CR=1 FL=1|jgi:hypothetical protein